jgi:hypothetical protein
MQALQAHNPTVETRTITSSSILCLFQKTPPQNSTQRRNNPETKMFLVNRRAAPAGVAPRRRAAKTYLCISHKLDPLSPS